MAQPLILYDIPSPFPKKAWSPNPWKARLALNAKGLAYSTIWIEYPDIAILCKSIGAEPTETHADGPLYTLPVLQDPNSGAVVSDSFKIAKYLDETYPNTIRLLPEGTAAFQAMFVGIFVEKVMFGMLKTFAENVALGLSPPSREYFRQTREKVFGMKIEDIAPEGPARDRAWQEVLDGFSIINKWKAEEKGIYMMGDEPSFADIVVLAQLQSVKIIVGAESRHWKDIVYADGGRWASLYKSLETWLWVDEGSVLDGEA